MAKKIRIPAGNGFTNIPVGPFSFEIDSPTRSDAAVITITRTSAVWPVGPLFSYTISESFS